MHRRAAVLQRVEHVLVVQVAEVRVLGGDDDDRGAIGFAPRQPLRDFRDGVEQRRAAAGHVKDAAGGVQQILRRRRVVLEDRRASATVTRADRPEPSIVVRNAASALRSRRWRRAAWLLSTMTAIGIGVVAGVTRSTSRRVPSSRTTKASGRDRAPAVASLNRRR